MPINHLIERILLRELTGTVVYLGTEEHFIDGLAKPAFVKSSSNEVYRLRLPSHLPPFDVGQCLTLRVYRFKDRFRDYNERSHPLIHSYRLLI